MPLNKKLLTLYFISFVLTGCVQDDLNFNKIGIAKYPENKASAISFTFDDGYPSEYNIIAPLFEEYNYRASFFVIVGNIRDEKTWDVWRNLSLKGFEIGNHSLTHLNLLTVYDTVALKQEIVDSYDLFTEKMGKKPFTFVHPFHTSNPVANALIFTKHFATRLAPKNFCSWEAWPSTTSEQWVKKKIDSSIEKGLWYVPCAHGINDSCCPITESFLRNILDYVKSHESDIFLDTFENLAKYSIERDNTKLIVSDTDEGKVIELRSMLDSNVFNYPLLVVINDRLLSSVQISPLNGNFTSKQVDKDIFIYAKPHTTLLIKSYKIN